MSLRMKVRGKERCSGMGCLLVIAISRLSDGSVAPDDDVLDEGVRPAEGGFARRATERVVVGVAVKGQRCGFQDSRTRKYLQVRRKEEVIKTFGRKVLAYKVYCAPAKAVADKTVPMTKIFLML